MKDKQLFKLTFEYQGVDNVTAKEIIECIEHMKRYRNFPTWMKVKDVEELDSQEV